MNDLYESYNYDVTYRTVLSSDKVIKVFTDKDFIEVDEQMSFDIEYSKKTSFNYFATSIISGIIYNLLLKSKENKLNLQDIEGKIKLTLKNPLSLLSVKGYFDEPKIENCEITIYVYSELEDDELIEFCKNSLKSCFMYNTLKNAMDIKVKFVPIL